MTVAMPSWMECGVASQVRQCSAYWAPAGKWSPRPARRSRQAAQWWRTAGGRHTSPISPAPAWSGSRSSTASSRRPLHPAGWCSWVGTQCPPPGWMVLSGIPGLCQFSLKQRTLQFLISHWKLMQARRSSSLLSNASMLASRMLGREDPCGWDRSRCLINPCPPRYFLQCWGRCIDGNRDGLACL